MPLLSPTKEDIQVLIEELRLVDVREAAQNDPKALINEIRYFDPTTQEWVEFRMFPPEGWEPVDLAIGPAKDWFWQSQIIDWWQDPEIKRYMILKARQLGITLLACARALWLMLYRPGSACVAFSYEEGEAKKLVEATWSMFNSLPEALRNGVVVISPMREERPSEWIRLKHPDGRMSTFQAMPATKKHGHGGRLTWCILDEAARQDYFREVWEAINPTISRGKVAKLCVISTASGLSNAETGEGNYFHRLYSEKEERQLAFQFLPWNLEPTRDENWYANEAMALPEVERNRQFPRNEADAFMLSGSLYFDREALEFYRAEARRPLKSGQFIRTGSGKSSLTFGANGPVQVFTPPRKGAKYTIGVDTATGRGTDYTVGTVLDLASGEIAALFRAKMESPEAAFQFHFLGKWYNEALICVERQGGYGEALITHLRDGVKGLPPYGQLYRHQKILSSRKPVSDEFGLPMSANRPGIVSWLSTLVKERFFPYLPIATMGELGTFVYAASNPSPRGQDGCNDDCVMSLAIAAEMYRLRGQAPEPRHHKLRKKNSGYRPHPVRQLA